MTTKQSKDSQSKLVLFLFWRWFSIIIAVSAMLIIVTFASYALEGSGFLSRVLWGFGMGGENNFGAWWSGMLLLLGAVLAFDGYCLQSRSEHQRRGWLVLALILLILSFDEVASLHEDISLVLYAVVGLSMLTFATIELILGRIDRRAMVLILLSFGLFGTIAMQEYLQQTLTWNNKAVYGARAMLEEGTEIVAMLILISVTRANTSALLRTRSPDALSFTVRLRTPLIGAGIILAPALAGATFIMPFPGGPANWLAASLYLLCALAVIRSLLIGLQEPSTGVLLLLALYLGASVMSCFVRFTYDLTIMGTPISLRGLGICTVLLVATKLMKMTGRQANWVWMRICAILVFLIAWWSPDAHALSQLLWCLLPSVVALWIYAIESRERNSQAQELWSTHPVRDFNC